MVIGTYLDIVVASSYRKCRIMKILKNCSENSYDYRSNLKFFVLEKKYDFECKLFHSLLLTLIS